MGAQADETVEGAWLMRRLLVWFLASACALQAQIDFVDPQYTEDLIHAGDGITVIKFDSTGRLFAGEKIGRILLLNPDGAGGFDSAIEFANLSSQVDFANEAGLLGMAIDPNFTENRHIFLFYTTPTDQRLTRITANASFTTMEAGSEVVLLSGLPRLTTIHNAGDIEFHPDDDQSIFVALGDDGQGHLDLEGIPIAQNPNSYLGKILRVSKDNGQGVESNPFWDGDPDSIRSRVWAVGFRNPFRIAFHPSAPNPDVLYSSENGNGTDRVSWVLRGSNGEWNGQDINGNGFGFLNPTDPDHRILATIPPSLIGIAIAESGPFAPGGPTLYVANWLSGIRRWNLTGADLDTATPIASDGGQVFTEDIVGTDLAFGPDGNLYTAWSNGGDSSGGFFTIYRVRFSGVDPPVAAFTTSPNPARGPTPLEVDFTDQSTAPGSTLSEWLWDFGDGATSSAANPTHTFSDPGRYQVRLTVRNSEGLSDSTEATVEAFQTVTVNLSGTVFDGRSLPAMPLSATTQLRFYQLDEEPIAITGGLGPDGNGLSVVAGTISGSVDLQLTGAGFLVTAGEDGADGVFHATLGVEVSSFSGTLNANLEFYLSDLVIRGRCLDYRDAPAEVDLGLAKTSPGNWVAVAGGRDYLPGSGIPLTGINHRRTTDAMGFYHFAIPSAQGGGTYHIQVVADTNEDNFAPLQEMQTLTNELTANFTLARYAGGIDCDDLSGIPVTLDVDFDTQIQPIFDAGCIGCHTAGATNSGGLNLQSGAAESQLVGVPSTFANGLKRVTSGQPDRSYLFEKINCASPQTGNRMRPTNAMTPAEQALIRDWITQLNQSCQETLQNQYPNWPEIDILDLMGFVCP